MERTFWIQGRTGRYWQNLESLDSDQTAIVRLGALISEDRYDELRLIQAQVNAITGETDYTNIVTIRDGQVIDSPMLRAQRDADSADDSEEALESDTADLSPEDPIPATDTEETVSEPHPQLKFWPTPKPENMQGRLGLTGETPWAPDVEDHVGAAFPEEGAHAALGRPPVAGTPASSEASAEAAPKSQRRKATFVPHVTVHSGPLDDDIMAGGWKIPRDLDEKDIAPTEKRSEDALPVRRTPDAETSQPPLRSGLTADPGGRDASAERGSRRFGLKRFGAARRQTAAGQPDSRGTGPNRVALMSGVFAGALATGLALSAINPDFAGRFFAGVSGQVGDFLPKTTLIDAIANGDLQTVRARLAEGTDPNSLDSEGNPALLRAARAGNLAAVSLLLQAGADPTLPTKDGRSILHRIAAEGRSQALQRMIDAGAPVDLAGGVYGCLTPLAVASANGRVRAASLLAERGASFDPQRGCSVGPMEIAAGHPHVLARLEQVRAERDALLLATRNTAPPPAEPDKKLVTAQLDPPAPAPAPAPSPAMEAPPALEPAIEETSEAPKPATSVVSSAPVAQFSIPDTPPPDVSVTPEMANAAKDLSAAINETLDRDAPAPPPQQVANVGSESGVFMPPPKPAPPAAPTDPRVFTSRLKSAIDAGNEGTVVALLGSPPPGFSLDDAKYAVEDGFGSGVRTALEQAALNGQANIVRLLADDGASIPPKLIHRVVQHADRPELASMLGVLLEEGADPNGLSDGLTPLMRASLRGDPETAYMLMAFGANPSIVSADGRLASDFARESGRADLEERLVLAASEPQYRDLMMGLSWSDNLASVRDRIEVCKDIGDDFTACKLRVDTWLKDAKVVVAQFDRKASDRLVAIQIDSHPIASVSTAVASFETARRSIQERVPAGHAGFVTTDFESNDTLFRDLRPEVNQGRYFSYWPDQDRRRPVFIHLKLAGLDDNRGFYRVVIGNPFRAS
ncbi:MAG: ankyrin repeat domain-containing protein [Alphaproteobacteria bacterium]|nr:ankyrin repeat domain-containing protein [Alphaproteobacteria bacterium]